VAARFIGDGLCLKSRERLSQTTVGAALRGRPFQGYACFLITGGHGGPPLQLGLPIVDFNCRRMLCGLSEADRGCGKLSVTSVSFDPHRSAIELGNRQPAIAQAPGSITATPLGG
jgi:hypothetical protein